MLGRCQPRGGNALINLGPAKCTNGDKQPIDEQRERESGEAKVERDMGREGAER